MKVIGHRGAKGLAPENTLASVTKALEHHVDEIEVDVRVTADGIVVLDHDGLLIDPNGSKKLIKNATYSELKTHKPDLTTLDEAISVINRRVPLYIEVKKGEPLESIIKCIQSYLDKKWQPADFLLSSKHQPTLRQLHDKIPAIEKIVIHPWSGVIATRRAKQVNTKRISMNQVGLWGGFIHMMSRNGWRISAYPLNSQTKAQKWEKSGLYAVITDYPDLFDK